jgi:xylan 1,4-beta-xylosidase
LFNKKFCREKGQMSIKKIKITVIGVISLFLSANWLAFAAETNDLGPEKEPIKQQTERPAISGSLVPSAAEGMVTINVDASAPGEPLRHVWQYFGYDECNCTTTPGAKELMKTLANINPEPVYLRQHFLLTNGDGKPEPKWGSTNVYTEDSAGNPIYDWRIMDEIFDAILASGCRPLVEIGFMPKDLSSKPEPYKGKDVFSRNRAGVSYPPKDYDKWAELIRQWARHSLARYKNVEETWWWELWNEPNILYWQGTFEEYCKLFDYTEHALHEVLPKAILGGPHSVGNPSFLRRFLEHCLRGTNSVTGKQGTRLDYIGFHSKGRTRYINGHPQMEQRGNLSMNKRDFSVIASFPEFRNTPVIIGECDPEGLAALSARVEPANSYRNGSAYAAYEIALMKHTLDLAAQHQINLQGVLTWAFTFDGSEYFGGFRSLATNGIHKPVLNGFKMLGMLRGRRIPVTSSGALGLANIVSRSVRERPDIDGLATATDEKVQVLIWNYHDDMVDVAPSSIQLTVKVPPNAPRRARIVHYRIDDTHSNSFTRWIELGKPQNPSPEMITDLNTAAQLQLLEPIHFCDVSNNQVQLNFSLPRYGVSLVEIYWGT